MIQSFLPHYGSGIDSTSNRNEYQEYFLGGKVGWCVGPAARLLRSWIRIPPRAWIFVCCGCRVLSSRGLCDELITRPEESYRLCCVVVCDLETSRIGVPCIYIYDISSLRVNLKTVADISLSWQWDYVQRKHFRDIKWKLTSHTHWGDRITCNGLSAVYSQSFKSSRENSVLNPLLLFSFFLSRIVLLV